MSEIPSDPWSVSGAAPADAVPPPPPRWTSFDWQRHFEDSFRSAVSQTAALQAIAWAGMVERFGSATALQLAPVLLPSLIEAAIREAGESTQREAQAWSTQKALEQFPAIPNGQPW